MNSLIFIYLRLIFRNKRLKDILIFVIGIGIALWGLAIHEYFTVRQHYSFNETTFIFQLTVSAFLIPISLTSNLFSFFYTIIRYALFLNNYTEVLIVRSFLIFFTVTNLCYCGLFLMPIFLVNQEFNEFLSLTLFSTGIGIPVSILISSLKISQIDLTRSKTFNYSGLSATIISLTVVLLLLGFLTFNISEVLLDNQNLLPSLFGASGILLFPFWTKLLKARLTNTKYLFGA